MDRLESPQRADRLPVEDVLDRLEAPPTGWCLDLGCGTGYIARPLADRVGEDRVVGLDIQREMLAEMARRSEASGVRVRGVQAAATALPFQERSFVRVLSVNLHHEVDDPAAMLAEIHRVLEPGGRVLIVDWAPVESPTGPPIEFRVPAETITDQLGTAGFEHVQQHGTFAYHSAVVGRRPG